jgi:predicted phage gp36 major capsid-like protein
LSEKIQRITDDKDQTEQKYDQKRRAMKEMEAKLTKAINQLEREKVILEEKHGHLHG